MSNFRIGFGFDVHRLEQGEKFIIGGVEIDFSKGLAGHSDADVLVHSLIDALLGALALGDIGKWFPNNDEKYRGISSLKLLEQVVNSSSFQNYTIGNIDFTIIAQQPKMSPYIGQMRENLAKTLNLDISAISIKATTTEYLGYVGREEGVACFANILIYKVC